MVQVDSYALFQGVKQAGLVASPSSPPSGGEPDHAEEP